MISLFLVGMVCVEEGCGAQRRQHVGHEVGSHDGRCVNGGVVVAGESGLGMVVHQRCAAGQDNRVGVAEGGHGPHRLR